MLLSSAGGLILDFAVARLTAMKIIFFPADFSPLPFFASPFPKGLRENTRGGKLSNIAQVARHCRLSTSDEWSGRKSSCCPG